MFISLQELERRNVPFKLDLPAGELELDSKLRQSSALHSEGIAQLLSGSLGEIRIQGDLRVDIEGIWDRCTEAAVYPVNSHFDLVYVPSEKSAAGGEDEVDEAGLEVGYYDGNGVQLSDVFREAILLDLPMRMVCSEDCKGICPVCGENKNQTDCGCRPVAADDRWSKLKMLRAELGPHN